MPVTPQGLIVILTGAGISRESGLHTFRDADGIWARVRIEDVATPEAFVRDPDRVNAFYNERRRQLRSPEIKPNAAHIALADLEERWPGEFILVTQNIDNLHERAGSRNLLHMHGELARTRCTHCEATFASGADLSMGSVCPECRRAGGLRPDVVWFGEVPYGLEKVFQLLQRCAVFVAIGTSGHVYPAAQFVSEAARHGAHTVELNMEPSQNAFEFSQSNYGPATSVVPEWVEEILTDQS
jgi:NAD-dependent deacetylase